MITQSHFVGAVGSKAGPDGPDQEDQTLDLLFIDWGCREGKALYASKHRPEGATSGITLDKKGEPVGAGIGVQLTNEERLGYLQDATSHGPTAPFVWVTLQRGAVAYHILDSLGARSGKQAAEAGPRPKESAPPTLRIMLENYANLKDPKRAQRHHELTEEVLKKYGEDVVRARWTEMKKVVSTICEVAEAVGDRKHRKPAKRIALIEKLPHPLQQYFGMNPKTGEIKWEADLLALRGEAWSLMRSLERELMKRTPFVGITFQDILNFPDIVNSGTLRMGLTELKSHLVPRKAGSFCRIDGDLYQVVLRDGLHSYTAVADDNAGAPSEHHVAAANRWSEDLQRFMRVESEFRAIKDSLNAFSATLRSPLEELLAVCATPGAMPGKPQPRYLVEGVAAMRPDQPPDNVDFTRHWVHDPVYCRNNFQGIRKGLNENSFIAVFSDGGTEFSIDFSRASVPDRLAGGELLARLQDRAVPFSNLSELIRGWHGERIEPEFVKQAKVILDPLDQRVMISTQL